MCGILFHVSTQCSHEQAWWDSLASTNGARGPDGIDQKLLKFKDKQVRLQGSVLALRGTSVTRQPIFSTDSRLLLLWNGEVFDSLSSMDMSLNDGEQILSQIEKLLKGMDGSSLEEIVSSVLSSVEGPYALVLFDTVSGSLIYGRDPLGRRSLLESFPLESEVILCSAASLQAIQRGIKFAEVDCSSLWSISVNDIILMAKRVPRMTTQYTKSFRLRELQDNRDDLTLAKSAQENGFLSFLSQSVRKRVCLLRPHGSTKDAQVAILFSGGLDCCTLALLAHRYIDSEQPIDLLNVAFENPRVLQANLKTEAKLPSTYDVPDRKTGLQSLEELRSVAPTRQWNFVEVNVSHQEYLSERGKIESLMEPCQSVMDLSIAAALYFACRGRGIDGYTSSAKVLLSGLGADELLGGYSRHRKAFARSQKQGLVKELQMDLDRLATRNLGRDDRILSSSGKEARYPFLSHSVISFLADLPVEAKMDFVDLPPGQGDKRLLREVALGLGLKQTSLLVKRAIQFGARSAKMEIGDGKILGHEKLKG